MTPLPLVLLLTLAANEVTLSSGGVAEHDSAECPNAAVTFHPVTLPDAWRDSRPDYQGSVWYRLTYRPLHREPLSGVLLPHVNETAAVCVNGTLVGTGGTFSPAAHNWNRPLYFPFPTSLLDADNNHIDVRVFGYRQNYASLSPILVGPDDGLRDIYRRLFFLQITLAQAITVLALVTAFFMGVLSLGTNQAEYRYLTVLCLVWAVYSLNAHIQDVPMPDVLWGRLFYSTLWVLPVLAALFVHRLCGWSRPRLERLLWAYAAIALLLTCFFSPAQPGSAMALLPVMSVLITVYAFLIPFHPRAQIAPSEKLVFGVVNALVVGSAVMDWWAHQFGSAQGAVRPLTYTLPVVLIANGAILTMRFVKAFNRARDANTELERRVEANRQELSANFERLRALESQQLLSGERERMMREMHDGVGAHLVAALSMVELGTAAREEVSEALRGALEEIRIVIDSIDPLVDDIPTLLGMLRGRLAPKLERQGLQVRWQVNDVPPLPHYGPREYLHVLRIIQEAFSNTLRHARAKTLTMRVQLEGAGEARHICIVVADDGRGGPRREHGRGLKNMEYRAVALGATFHFDAREDGTTVTLRLPLQRQSSSVMSPIATAS